MTHFIQMHLLTSYPPANLNRDDLGRPKTAMMGGRKRLRVSSQSLKRTWRTSELFEDALGEYCGKRTKKVGVNAAADLIAKGVDEKKAKEWAVEIAKAFAAVEKGKLETGQLVHIGPEEQAMVDELVTTLAEENRAPEKAELQSLRRRTRAVDVALFGRMLAEHQDSSVDAACQVAHAITVHAAEVEDDYFTAVDDLNTREEHRGAAHVGDAGFGAGLFYSYVCIDRHLLEENLDGDRDLADRAIAALLEAAVRTSPKGKQNSFGSRAHASYVLVEAGDQQPRSLSVSFLKPVGGDNQALDAIQRLERQVSAFDGAYGAGADRRFVLSAEPDYPGAPEGMTSGDLASLIEFLKADR